MRRTIVAAFGRVNRHGELLFVVGGGPLLSAGARHCGTGRRWSRHLADGDRLKSTSRDRLRAAREPTTLISISRVNKQSVPAAHGVACASSTGFTPSHFSIAPRLFLSKIGTSVQSNLAASPPWRPSRRPIRVWDLDPSNTCFIEPTWVSPQWLSRAVQFWHSSPVGLTIRQTDTHRHTHHATCECDIRSSRPHLCTACRLIRV